MKSRLLSIVCFCALAAAQDPQTPPPAQTPPQTPPPAQTTPPSAPGTPSNPKPQVEVAPSSKPTPPTQTQPAERDTGGDALSIEPLYWDTSSVPHLRQGHGYTSGYRGDLNLNGDKKYALGAIVSVPTGHENSLEFTYNRLQGQGNTVLPTYYTFFGDNFAPGDVVANHFNVQHVKLSWNYLTYPFPSNHAKFRLKTLYEVQWVDIRTEFDSPADTSTTTTQGSRDVVLPTFGIGMEYHPAHNVRFEVKGTGFGLYHRADIWDAEASLVVRINRVEAMFGEKAFHYKTTPQADQFYVQTIIGPYIGLRWMFK